MHTYIYLLYIPAQRFPPNQIPKESSTSCKTKQEHKESVYGAIKTASRNRMGHAVADKFVYWRWRPRRRSQQRPCLVSAGPPCDKHARSDIFKLK